MKLRQIAAAAIVIAPLQAFASGDYAPTTFVNTDSTDIAYARFQAGQLGVLRPTYHRMYLYAAWRAIALGEQGAKSAANRNGGLQRALGEPEGGWADSKNDTKVFEAWQAQVDGALKQVAAPANREYFAGYLSCPARSYEMATTTLAGLARRSDATPARLRGWLASQRQVFKFCGDDPEQAVNDGSPKKAPAMPEQLPAAEALHWRQMQQYQLAAAAFYGAKYDISSQRFGKIGATPGHPLRQWGAYLGLRALVRGAVASEEASGDAMATIARTGAAILADPTLAALHEDTRALVRSAQAALIPEQRFEELSRLLDNPAGDPYADDRLGDWRVLADQVYSSDQPALLDAGAKMRKEAGFIDWVQTLRDCGNASRAAKKRDCAEERAHAERQWRQALAQKDATRARLWLAAAAIMADTLNADLEKAALQVAPGAPEYLSMRYALARHYRLAGQAGKARSTSEAALASAQLRDSASTSARNLFLQERFALATSLDDAAGYLARQMVARRDADSGESVAVDMIRPDGEGMLWLNTALATSELAAGGNHARVPASLRARIAVAAWLRAGLLGDGDSALRSAAVIEKSVPALADVMRQYRTLPEDARRNFMLVSAMRFSLSPTVGGGGFGPYAERSKEETLADMWCKIPVDPDGSDLPGGARPFVLPAADAAVQAARAVELAALGKLKTASGYVGEHVLARADAVPADPELPWMLHVVVKSTRGGCLDSDAKVLSKTAFGVLHKRFRKSPWAVKTPYHY